jgi:hypothetical protein
MNALIVSMLVVLSGLALPLRILQGGQVIGRERLSHYSREAFVCRAVEADWRVCQHVGSGQAPHPRRCVPLDGVNDGGPSVSGDHGVSIL